MLFAGFLWSPARDKWTDILNEICPVYQKIFYFDNREYFDKLVLDIYSSDDISPDTVKNVKLKSMAKYEPSFLFYLFDIPDPKFRIKREGVDISTVVEATKKHIRRKYKEYIKDYIMDIIIHVADNDDQTRQIIDILCSEHILNITDYLNEIDKLNYALIKVDTPYMTNNYPHNYPIGKDMDIIVSKRDFAKLIDITKSKFLNIPFLEKSETINTQNYRLRFEFNSHLHYQIDISCHIDGLVIDELLENRYKRNGYNILKDDAEYKVRNNEINKHPTKQHHRIWIENYLKKLPVGT